MKRCKNSPVCVRERETAGEGYCDECKALRVLLSSIHGDDDHSRTGSTEESRRRRESVARRLEMHRRRAAGLRGLR